MGTAVLSPQDCLASRQSRPNCHFLSASERPSAATRSSGRGSSAPSFVTDCARHGSSGNTNLMECRSLLGRKNVSAGLLPLPDQALWSTHPSFHRSAPKISSCMFGEKVNNYVSRQSSSFLHSSLGSAASGLPLARYPSVPCANYKIPTPRWVSDCSPMLGVQSYERMLPRGRNQSVVIARLSSNSAQGKCMVGPWSCVAGVASSYRKLVFPDAQGKSTCKVISTVGRKHGVSRQLKKSSFEKVQDSMKMSILQRPSTEEAARKLITSLFEEATCSHTSNCRSNRSKDNHKSSAPLDSFVEEKIVVGIQRQGSWNVGPQESCWKTMSISKVGQASLPRVTVSQQLRGTKRDSSVSWHEPCLGGVNTAMGIKGGIEEDHSTSISSSITQGQHDVPKVHGTGTFDIIDSKVTATDSKKSDSVLEIEGILRSLDSVLDSNRCLSMTSDEKWAGPSFFNSPAPSALPVPSFTSKLSRVTSTCSVPTHTPDCGVQIVPSNLFPEEKHTWDVAIATMDLRRMLNLDCACLAIFDGGLTMPVVGIKAVHGSGNEDDIVV